MTFSEEVQRYFQENYVNPARKRGESRIDVKAGDIHRKLGWSRRVPLVCAALSSQKLQRRVGVRLKQKDGPPSGQSPTVIFHFEILNESGFQVTGDDYRSPRNGLLAVYGICADIYREFGGSEAFIRSQREDFGSIVPDLPPDPGEQSE
jgi:hypothetical protein